MNNRTDTERYIRAATRGLWGKARRELRAELEGHIRLRMSEFMLAGYTPAEAERQTLRELGAAGEVSTGMAQVHTLPAVMKGGVGLALMATALLSTTQQVQAQVQSIYDGEQGCMCANTYLNLSQLQQELGKSGAKLTQTDGQFSISLPDAPRKTYPLWGGSKILLQKDGQDYLNAVALLSAIQNTGTPTTLSGWNNPTIQAGKTKIQVQTQDWHVINSLYHWILLMPSELNTYGAMPLTLVEPNGNTSETTIKNSQIHKGGIYALVLPQFNKWGMIGVKVSDGTIMLTANIVHAEQDGQLTFRLYNDTKPYKLMPSAEAMQKVLDPLRSKTKTWTDKMPAPGVLLELNGKVAADGYRVLAPAAAAGASVWK